MKSRVEQYEASSGILNQVLDDIRRQIRSLPANSDQARSAVRRELDSFRSTLEGAMRRLTTTESNIRTLNGMNNRIMAQLTDIEGHVDEAADIIQGVQDNQMNPQQPRERRNRERRNVGYNAFAGQGHRIRSPTPTPGEGNGRGTGLPVRPGGGVDLVDHALPDMPGRVDPSHAGRHPINPDRERADSRSRRARGLPDRSHSPPGRARDGPRTRERGDISVSPNRDVGRNRSPRPAAVPDRGSEVRGSATATRRITPANHCTANLQAVPDIVRCEIYGNATPGFRIAVANMRAMHLSVTSLTLHQAR